MTAFEGKVVYGGKNITITEGIYCTVNYSRYSREKVRTHIFSPSWTKPPSDTGIFAQLYIFGSLYGQLLLVRLDNFRPVEIPLPCSKIEL